MNKSSRASGANYTIFRIGGVRGRITPRVERVAEMLSNVDSAKATTNLWGEGWPKLTMNSMGNGVSASTGLSSKGMTELELTRRWKRLKVSC